MTRSEEHVQFQRTFYDKHFAARAAAVPDQLAHPLFRSFNERTAELAFAALADGRGGPPSSNGRAVRVLEVGCGEGLVADAIRRVADGRAMALTYTGLDVSASAVELARRHVEGELLVGDAYETLAGMPSGSRDLVIGKNLLHHLDNPADFLREAGRVAGPAGRVVMFEPNLGCPQFLLFNVLAFRRERFYFLGQRRNRRAFADAGLGGVRSQQFSWLPYELLFVIRYPVFRRLLATGRSAAIERVSRADDTLARRLPAFACYTVWSATGTAAAHEVDAPAPGREGAAR